MMEHGHDYRLPKGSFYKLVTGPASAVVSVAEVKGQAVVDPDITEDDAEIQIFIDAATEMVDAQFGEFGKALITQTWAAVMPKFPNGTFHLDYPPIQSIDSITYYDADNVQQTLSASAYRLVSQGEFGVVELDVGQSWPATYGRADAVSVQFVTGYGDAPSDVPEGIRLIVLMLAAHFYENREALADRRWEAMPMGIRFLAQKYRTAKGFF